MHSPRLIQPRAAEIANELLESFEFSPPERLAVNEAARCIAILEAIDRDLDQRGLVDTDGNPRYLLNHRTRTSRQLEHWLEKVSAAVAREAANDHSSIKAEYPDYVRALQRIALGRDATATARDRLSAIKELLGLGDRGTTAHLEWLETPEAKQRWNALHDARRRHQLEYDERNAGLKPEVPPE